MRHRRSTWLTAILASSCVLASCQGGGDDPGGEPRGAEEPSLCAAVRGNGQLITAHFASLARVVEHYGTIDGASGGSSGSITLFLLESIQMNPEVSSCRAGECSNEERAARVALLLKSLQGYLHVLSEGEEVSAVRTLANLVPSRDQVVEDAELDRVRGMIGRDAKSGVEALRTLLQSEGVRDLINPEALALLDPATSPDPVFFAGELLEGVKNSASFSTDSDRILFRPGLLNFGHHERSGGKAGRFGGQSFPEKIGRVANFYAGYGPADSDRMKAFLDSCAVPGKGQNWLGVSFLPVNRALLPEEDSLRTTAGLTCGALFGEMLTRYRADAAAADSFDARIDDQVGAHLPALVSTSVLQGQSAEEWKKARDLYFAAEPYDFQPDFSSVRFGYWGRQYDLDRVAENRHGFDDDKTSRFLALGEATWREVLTFSPAEPGLSRALEIDEERGWISAGGWSDLHPSLALKNLGCERVVYVTRQGDEVGFASGMAGLLNASEAETASLYSVTEDSALMRSIAAADARWCTNWNEQDALDVLAVSEDAFNANMETADSFFQEAAFAPYPNLAARLDRVGCTPLDGVGPKGRE